FGGVVIKWDAGRIPFAADLRTSRDAKNWTTVRRIRANLRDQTAIRLPEHDARYVRLSVLSASSGVRDIALQPLGWAPTPNDLVRLVASATPRGTYPRAWTGEQSYWAVVGAAGDAREGLLSADGALEVGKGMFSVEPFVLVGKQTYSWNDVKSEPWLAGNALPLPGVTWRSEAFELRIATFAAGAPGRSRLYAKYRLTNLSADGAKLTLALAIRPLQVNPPWQSLQVTGGFAPIRSIDLAGGVARVNTDHIVATIPPAPRFMAVDFDAGDVTGVIAKGVPTGATQARDAEGMASGVVAWNATLAKGESKEVAVEIPLYEQPTSGPYVRTLATLRAIDKAQAAAEAQWDSTLSRTTISLPDTLNGRRIAESIRSSLGWILVNHDGAGVQPGSRSYERSWIRDGALTSAAILRLGQTTAVRDFITWYAKYQYANGKIPCCVDQRGADPVPEHDSHGEFIYLVAEYYRQTGDREFAAKLWPNVRRAVMYQDSLRHTRLTDVYQGPDSVHLYGLLPPSISHEGYSAKPMHSYWDDFWALRGYNDASMLAATLGKNDADSLATMRDDFRRDLGASIEKVMSKRRINYIPGAADLGDYDPTSTTIAIAPGEDISMLPQGSLESTFDRYWRESVARSNGTRESENY
ncbi:MAG: coagulation factor 5/8 type domain-containing protein, partial [Gemmatimonadaceae bacterium]